MDIAIIGMGIYPFGRHEGVSGLEMGAGAVRSALKDAGLEWKDMQFAYGGSQDGGNADTLVNKMGLTGLQFINVFNGCATGGSALFSAYSAIVSGQWDVGVAVGFDKHPRGAFAINPADWGLGKWYGDIGLALTTQFFGLKIQKYMHDYGITEDSLVRVAEKNFFNGSLNPNAWRRKALSYEEIASSPMLAHPLRQLMFCSPGEGAVALILCNSKKAAQFTRNPVYLKAAVVKTRLYGSFEVFSSCLATDQVESPTVQTSKAAYEKAGVAPEDIDIAQLQDTESGAEIMHMAENGLCKDGEQEKMLKEGETRIDGRLPVNTDGGCMAMGEPVGASGLRQVYEICLQLRGEAGNRQVPKNLKTGYSHVYGAPGLSGVTILQK